MYSIPNKLEYKGYTVYQEDVNKYYIELKSGKGNVWCISYEQACEVIDKLEGE